MRPLLLAKLFVISLFIPGEFHVNLGGLRLEAYRIVLGISVFSGLGFAARYWKRLESTDKVIIFAAVWGVLSLLINHGLVGGIEKSGIFFLELFGAYFLARQAIVNDRRLHDIYKLLTFMVVLFFIPTMIEMITGTKVVHEVARAITGNNVLGPSLFTESYMRHGFTRSTSAFSHPILNGTICATALPFAVYLFLRHRKPIYALLTGGIFLSVLSALSSAPLLVVAVQVALSGYVKLKQYLRSNIRFVVMGVLFLAAFIQIFSNRGLVKIIIHTATFNPHTGTHRLLIIEHLRDDIMRSPIFGSGLNAYWSAPGWMGQSIDNFWWAVAFIYGIPFSLMIAAAGFLCLKKINVSKVPVKDDYLAYAMKASILSLMVLGLTVHLFGKIHPLFYFVMGSSVFLFRPKEIRQKSMKVAKEKMIDPK